MSDQTLALRLPKLLPRVIVWATRESERILQTGHMLTPPGIAVARTVGVANPERIRVLEVPAIPAPEDPELQQVAREQNLIGPHTAGLTLGYGIFIVQGQLDVRLLSSRMPPRAPGRSRRWPRGLSPAVPRPNRRIRLRRRPLRTRRETARTHRLAGNLISNAGDAEKPKA